MYDREIVKGRERYSFLKTQKLFKKNETILSSVCRTLVEIITFPRITEVILNQDVAGHIFLLFKLAKFFNYLIINI